MIDFNQPFSKFRNEAETSLPPMPSLPPMRADHQCIVALLWILIRLVYEIGQGLLATNPTVEE